jgi:carbonic anhydrase
MTDNRKSGEWQKEQPLAAEVTYRFDSRSAHRPLPIDANAARLRLESGNRAFAEILGCMSRGQPARLSVDVDPYDVGFLAGHKHVSSQQPYAAVVGCADARVPIELIFSEGPNDLFVVRIAGNGLGDDMLGSLNYALDHLKDSLRTIVVLGHSQCGAVSAAVDVYLTPAKYMDVMTQKDLRHILDRTLILAQTGATWMERVHGPEVVRRPGYRTALIEVAIALNAALTAHGVRQALDVDARGGVAVVYGVYLLNERLLWSPADGDGDWFRLAPAPGSAREFTVICDRLVSSPRIRSLLEAA